MARFCILAGLMLAQLVLSGCSSRQQVDLTQWRDYRATTAEELPRPVKTSAKPLWVRSAQAMASRATDAHAEVGSVGTVGRGARTNDGPKHLGPWPKRGTPEFEQLQAEEIEQENRAKAATHSICRGC
jgi:outer membrane murein-binding lipoprotein Lpp